MVKNIDMDYSSSNFSGKVCAANESDLSFRVAGVIERIPVKEGSYVSAGDVVAYMDKRDYELQLEATEAEYDAIKGEAQRVIDLYQEKSVSENDYDKAVSGLKRITAKRTAHRNALNDTEITAPFSGYVQKIYFTNGEAVSAGLPIVKLISSSTPEIEINIPSREFLKIKELTNATAAIDLYPDEEIKLRKIGVTHSANLNQLHRVRFSTVGDVLLTPGMSAIVKLNYATVDKDLVTLPLSAIHNILDKDYVWVVKDGKVSLHEIRTQGVQSNGLAIIKSGVKAGETVVTAGINSLKEGQEVEIIAEKSKTNIGGVL